MKMQKSTMILSGVLGVISVGSVLMFANPGMQEALVSNIFGSRMYSVPAKPVTPAVINKTPWGVTPSKPSISGEVIVTNKGKYEGFMNGRLFISTASITKEEAYSHCKQNSANNMNSNIRCTWNGVEIFSRGVVPTPSISGETYVRPSTSSSGTIVMMGYSRVTVDGKIPSDYPYHFVNEKDASYDCEKYARTIPTTSKYSCIWNNKELSKGFGTKVVLVTKPIQAPVVTKPTTPTKPVDVLANITVRVDGKNQPDIYNTSKINEKEAVNYCTNLASKVLTTSKFSCIWNGKELSKGYGTKIVVVTKPIQAPVVTKPTTPANTGSTSTGTVVVPKTPVSTGSVMSGITNSGSTTSLGRTMITTGNELLSETIDREALYILSLQKDNGAIAISNDAWDGSNTINPYFANNAAINLLNADPIRYKQAVANYINWYFAHLNPIDKDGLQYTIYDYKWSNNTEISTNSYDSVDSYNATFLSLLNKFSSETGDKKFFSGSVQIDGKSIEKQAIIKTMADTILSLKDPNTGLTNAKKSYPIQYTMDNSEVYKGLYDGGVFLTTVYNSSSGAYFREQSLDLINSIQANLYKTGNIDKNGYYLPYYGANTPDMSRWYPDAQSQLFPLLFGAIHSGSHCFVYDNFKKNFPDWIDSKHADGRFPSSFIAKVAFMCNDYESLRLFLINTKQEFGNNGNKWPWNINEAGWLIDVSKVCEKNSSCKRVVER